MASIKIPTVLLFCKHTVLYILHTKYGLAKRAIQHRFVYFYYLENQFLAFQTVFMSVYNLRSALVTPQHRFSGVHVNISPFGMFGEWLKVSAKTPVAL